MPVPHGCANLLGAVPPLGELLRVPSARVHLYDKAPRAGRKVGHVTVAGADHAQMWARLRLLVGATTGEG